MIFHELKEAFNNNVDNLLVLDEVDKESLKKKLNIVKRLCMNELHLAACLLNPRNRNDSAPTNVLTADEEEEAAEFIHFFCETRGFQVDSFICIITNNYNCFRRSCIMKICYYLLLDRCGSSPIV